MAGFHPIAAAVIVGLALTAQAKSPASDLDDVRRGYIELQRDLALRDDTALPAVPQVIVYVSIDPRATATLAAASIEINDRVVSQPQYSAMQFAALRHGASDRTYIGTLPAGSNTLTATFSGVRDDGNVFVRVTHLDLPESAEPHYVDLELSHTQTKDVPDVVAQIADPNDVAAADAQCEWLLGCLVSGSAATPSDLVYRSVLYAYFQNDDERALLQAMAAIARGSTYQTGARERLQLAQVDTAFAIGARSIAIDVADAMNAEPLGPQERMRLAFLRARDSYYQQNWTALETSLDVIARTRKVLAPPPPVAPAIDAEIAFMRAELATAQGDFDRAQYIISSELSPQESFRAYALFNLGVVLRTSGIPTRSERVFTQLSSMPVYTAEALDIKQRARVALSVVNLQRTQSASAEAALRDAPAQRSLSRSVHGVVCNPCDGARRLRTRGAYLAHARERSTLVERRKDRAGCISNVPGTHRRAECRVGPVSATRKRNSNGGLPIWRH